MKKIIDGRMYDTDTAKLLTGWDNGLDCTSFDWLEEDLYLKRTGEYFIFGRGGAATRYSDQCGRTYSAGWSITPVSDAEARVWCERHCGADTYIAIWGEPAE